MKILVFDASNAAYRAKHMVHLSYKGHDVSVLYGIIRIVLSQVKKRKPDAVIICYDDGYPDDRRLLVPTYKLHRSSDKDHDYDWDAFYEQLEESKRLFGLLGMVVATAPKLEADDLIGAAVRCLEYDDLVIISSDSDMLQLVSSKVTVFNPIKNKEYTPRMVEREYGVPPSRIALWKALSGDKADGVPGIRGVGPKTATKIINTLNTHMPNNVMNRIDELKGVVPSNVIEAFHDTGYKLSSGAIVISLLYDAYGSDYVLSQCMARRRKADIKAAKTFLSKHGFISIIADAESLILARRFVLPDYVAGRRFGVKSPTRKRPVL